LINFQLESFNKVGDLLKEEIEKYGKIVQFHKKEPFFSYDDTLKYFYIILRGKVKIYNMNINNGKEQTIYLLGRGDMFDTVTLLDNSPHDLMSEVLESGEALQLPLKKVKEWIFKYPPFGEIIMKYIASQLRQVEELASDLTLYDTKERLIKLIVKNLEKSKKSGINMLQNLSRAEIANLIGTVRHVVDRHINWLKSEGILDTSRKKFALKNMQKLQEKLDSFL
jgi:CRP-like cAMP-binding protein